MNYKSITSILLILSLTWPVITEARLAVAPADSLHHRTQMVGDSVSKVSPGENWIASAASISSVISVLTTAVGFLGKQTSFDPLPVVVVFGIVGLIGGILGFIKRRKLIAGKYKSHAQPEKLPLGQGRSLIGILALPASVILLLAVYSCG